MSTRKGCRYNVCCEQRQHVTHGHHSCANKHRQQHSIADDNCVVLTWEFHLPASLCCSESGLLWSSDEHSS